MSNLRQLLQELSLKYIQDNKNDKITISPNNFDEICCICHENLINIPKYDSLFQLTCFHVFHKKCIETWIHEYGSTKCPICNSNVYNILVNKDNNNSNVIG